ncbi:hypothetical protein ACFYTS_28210 [Nocardia sp. NPDC004151]|uniref:hypothetical protein n=1 Tax=Nocardia sp. NPDC004151 TaxID=3364304 RepID=UPI0036839E37
MRRTRPTAQQARERFDYMLTAALRGERPQRESGLDTDIEDLLSVVAKAFPAEAPTAVIDQARALVNQQVSWIENPPTEAEGIAELAKRFPDIDVSEGL